MLNKSDFKKIAQKIVHRRPEVQEFSIMHPAREWTIGLLIALLIVMTTGAWSAATYLQNRLSIETGLEIEMIEETVYRESLVQEAKTILSSRNQIISVFENIVVEDTATTSDTVESIVEEEPVEPIETDVVPISFE